MFKKYAAAAMAMTLLTSQAALAEAPTSQFGFKGWPYRQQTNCAVSTCAPEKTPDQGASPTLAADDGTHAQPAPTAEPVAPTAAPSLPRGRHRLRPPRKERPSPRRRNALPWMMIILPNPYQRKSKKP